MPPSSSTIINDNSTDCSHQTTSTTLVPPTSVPKHFNVPFAIQHGYFRSVRYLLELHFDPNERDSQLRTPLILCAYIENDRWSLSLSQNLLEKGAKIALDDHTRRNAMHHACALQRLELVQLYLSCLDFNIEAQDCEGNTCLHYIAISGNCEIAELLMRSAERIGIHLDQYVNREGCSAAVLALKYGHIECANQITHRDSDEFYVIPRPLSIYENPLTFVDNQSSSKLPRKTRFRSNNGEIHPSTSSFGLLKIIFSDSDTNYSNRLANLCKQDKQLQHLKHKKSETPQLSTMTTNTFDRTKTTNVNGTRYSSTQVLVNQSQLLRGIQKHHTSLDSNENQLTSGRISPRVQLLMQQQQQQRLLHNSNSKDNSSSFIQKTSSRTQLSIDDITTMKSASSQTDNEEIKRKLNIPTMNRQVTNLTLNQSENKNSKLTNNKLPHPKTPIIRNQIASQVNSAKIKRTQIPPTTPKKKSLLTDRIKSSSTVTKLNQSICASESSTHPTRIISVVSHSTSAKSNDLSQPIREAKGPTSRYNKPEELFGLRPVELFCTEQHQPKIFDQCSTTKTNESVRSKRHHLHKSQHIWQQDVDKIIELYNIHHSVNYRKTAVPPISLTQGVIQTDTITDVPPASRSRRMSITKHSSTNSKSSTNPKQSALASLNIPARNSVHRLSIKLTNA